MFYDCFKPLNNLSYNIPWLLIWMHFNWKYFSTNTTIIFEIYKYLWKQIEHSHGSWVWAEKTLLRLTLQADSRKMKIENRGFYQFNRPVLILHVSWGISAILHEKHCTQLMGFSCHCSFAMTFRRVYWKGWGGGGLVADSITLWAWMCRYS